jgi:predicted Rossmann-fold nucleotide-binding protein
MKHKIGVFGSGGGSVSDEVIQDAAMRLGAELGARSNEVIVITGACTGLPYFAAQQASKAGTDVWGFSPVLNMQEQRQFTPNDNLDIYTKLEFIPEEIAASLKNQRERMKFRNVLSTSSCDAGIIISGRWGSLNEFTNLVDMQKPVGVLTGTGGIADELPDLCRKIVKEGQGPVIFNDDPQLLVDGLFKLLAA